MVKNIKNPVSLQNIHFGKIVLTFMLVGMMILGNVEYVNATEWTVVASETIIFFNPGEESIKSTRVVYDGNNVYAEAIVWGMTALGNKYERTYKTNSVSRKTGASYMVDIVTMSPTPPLDGERFPRKGLRLMEFVNTPPTIPSSITVPTTIKSDNSFTVSWGTSTDADGDSITYRLERQVNGGSWAQVYSGSSRSHSDTALSSWNTLAYRVKAYDSKEYSAYRTSPTRIVIHNTIPTLTIITPSENSYFV